MSDTFTKWLFSGDTHICYFQRGNGLVIIIRIEQNKNFDYLFIQENYECLSVSNTAFKYAGIYCKRDKSLYDLQRELKNIVEDFEIMKDKNRKSLLEQLAKTVRHRVENFINNDRNNLQITELKDSKILRKLEDTKFRAKEEARKVYFNAKPIIYQCSYVPDNWKEDSLLEYILDSESYAQKEAEAYINNNQEEILASLLCNDIVKKEYEAILEDNKNPIHAIKKIRDAIKNTSAKTVSVTIFKNGIKFTFKTEVFPLCRTYENYYSTYYILSKDRQRFEQIFGSNVDYDPQEIIRITYKKTVLYEAE